ncbi:1-acyl-sn-glycerol-3-phosphate acyltransferase [Streptomyces sp. N35]|uniref:1-acyl-sn-glycerol-3-phosphate acyltransferase n=1 Tax=Streptomyces sp. N35 TaxID=2795730 RepID=UPI0018F5248A|nr:1-acyl-sn-glycerol-3-phosphate acyltransferase [Streptomyces sp. N35]
MTVPDRVGELLRRLSEDYFRIEVSGLDNIPASGAALLAANHSGAWGFDGFVLHHLLLHRLARPVHFYASELVLRVPLLADYVRRHRIVTDDPSLGRDKLVAGELVALFPEGFDGVGKPFSRRYRLRPFSPGFAGAAVLTGAPVVPVSIVGAEETYPKLGEIAGLAGRFGLPYVPVTTPLPLPAKWLISFGEPIQAPACPGSYAERAAVARRLCDEVWFTVQGMVDRDRRRRATPFW